MLVFLDTLWESNTLKKKIILVVLLLSIFSLELSAKVNNYLINTSLKNNQLKLTFKYKLGHVKFFTLKNRGHMKYVYDVKNAVLPKGKRISGYKYKTVKAFRMGQFSKKYLRVVIESDFVNYKTYSVHGKVLTLNLPKGKPKKKFRASGKIKKVTKYSPRIIVDAGHGGKDVGASYKGIIEKNITLSLALKLEKQLIRRGYKVYMTRDKDKHLTLRKRTDYANGKKGSLFISLHTNAAPRKRANYIYNGIEVFYLQGRTRRTRYSNRKIYTSRWKKAKSRQICKEIKKGMLNCVRKEYTVRDKGIKRKNFWVLRGTKMPSLLVENGYITDKYEGKRLTDDYYQNLLVQGIVNGVDKYFKRL
jgi:N-acetylmuramoyl-L-alanine amidase